MGLVGVYLVNRTHRIDVANLEGTVMAEKAIEIEKFIGEVISLFQLQVGFEEYAEIELSQQQFLLTRMLEENPYLEEASFISLAGKETAKATRGVGLRTTLRDQSQQQKFLVAKDGRDYFGAVVFTPRGPTISVASPVINRKGEIISLLSGEVNLSPLQESFARVSLGNTGYLYLVDSRGSIVTHSKGRDVGMTIREEKVVEDVLTGKIRNGLGREDVYQSRWGERVIGSGKVIPPYFWAIIAEWPFEDAQRVVGTMLSQLAQFSLATVVLIFILSSVVALQLMLPIRELQEGAKIIGEGKFDYRIFLRTGDEIEELGHSLNKMAESLRELEELKEIKLKAKYLAESLAKEKELSKLKDQFISVASHQLYTPLSVINWSIETLRGKKLEKEELAKALAAIDQNRENMLNIVNDLLTVSEIGFRYEKTKSEMMDLGGVIQETREKYKEKSVAKKLKVEFKKEVTDDRGDFSRLAMEKVFENLIDNAITYSNDGGKILITLSGDKNTLTVSVKDEGIGIPEDEKGSIFREFFRAKNAVSKKNVGTGLGLFIVKSIVEGHGGKMSFTSQENKGSTFTFTIPRTTPKEEKKAG